MELGKLPPQNIELEEAVLGAVLLENDALESVIPILRKESFYKEINGIIFDSIQNLHRRNEPVDILTVTQELKRMGKLDMVGGSYYVSSLTNRIASSANIEFHARIVEQKFMQRELIRIGTDTIKEAYRDDADAFELIYQTDKSLSELINNISGTNVDSIGKIKDVVLDECELVYNTGHSTGVPCHIKALNNQTNGWQKGDLIVLASRPGMGKTAFAISCGMEAAQSGNPCAYFSIEVNKYQITSRVISQESGMNTQKIIMKKFGDGDVDYLRKSTKELDNLGFYIDDTPGISLSQLRSKARKLKKTKGIELIIIDYLQLMDGDGKQKGNREQEISTISRGLKKLAKELDIAIIALSQLSRDVEKRSDRKPQLSDLRESGAIEQDADMVLFLLRPEYYGFPDYDMGDYIEPSHRLCMILIAKFRHGQPGQIKSKWISELSMITNYDEQI